MCLGLEELEESVLLIYKPSNPELKMKPKSSTYLPCLNENLQNFPHYYNFFKFMSTSSINPCFRFIVSSHYKTYFFQKSV